MDLYDEFGNYIGPDLDESEGEDDEQKGFPPRRHAFEVEDVDDEEEENGAGNGQLVHRDEMDIAHENRIILHEDKKYYPDAEEVYPGVSTVTLDEDAQDLHEPIIKPIKQKNFSVLETKIPKLKYENEFFVSLMQTPALLRHVAILGAFHHGKTSFTDILIQATHEEEWDPAKEVRYADVRKDEQARELSVKSTTLSLVLEDLREKHYLINAIDVPGHINFSDEATCAIRAADGVVVVVDVVEGVMLHTERLLRQALLASLPITLVINKMDRLILELKLPPQDAYFKLMHTIEEVNTIISTYSLSDKPQRVSPELGNVCFASGQHSWCFTLDSFADMYCRRYHSKNLYFSAKDLSKRLWGDWYVNERTNAISKKKTASSSSSRTFVSFILEPLYKIYSNIIGEQSENLMALFQRLNLRIKGSEFHLDPRPLLKLSLRRFFGPPKGFVSMIIAHIPSPLEGNAIKVKTLYTGDQHGDTSQAMLNCRGTNDCPLMANVMKLYNTPEGNSFLALTRIYSGILKVGQKVKILGESYTTDDDEDMAVLEVTGEETLSSADLPL